MTDGTGPSLQRESQLCASKLLYKHLLKNRVFLGHFQEKRYVEGLNTYKDLVVLGIDEREFCVDVQRVTTQIRNECGPDIWVGFTGPDVVGAPAGHCIWATIKATEPSVTFGQYWFQIKTIRFKDREIEIQLKILRSAETSEASTSLSALITEELPKVEWGKLLISWKDAVNQTLYTFLQEQVTATNIVATLKFIGILAFVVIGGLLQSIKFIGEFTLRFMHEISKLIHVMTPMMMSILDMMQKIIGGFYMLLAMMWRDTIGGHGRSQNRNSINRPRYPALTSSSSSQIPYSRLQAAHYR